MDAKISLNKNEIVGYLKKPMSSFGREDIIKYVVDNGIEMVNFMYPAADGRLKTLNFVINDLEYLRTILTLGERVDGSSLFPWIGAGSSDLYVIPRYRTAFLDPFATLPTVTMLCSFCDKEGHPLEMSPEYTLRKACREFKETTGLEFEAMGELEFYVIGEDTGKFPATDQRGYHESGPFAKFNDFRTQCMSHIAKTGGRIKYGHSEVGNFSEDGKVYEQNEIEFLPVGACEAADQLALAKWVIRNEAARQGLDVTFAPKITVGKAGSGLHIHFRFMREGQNMMLDEKRNISEYARRGIAGLMKLAPALTAFGNRNPTSYFRLIPNQEAPTNVCWGDRNRSVLVRVPLGWTSGRDMNLEVNGEETPKDIDATLKQTVELRSGDGSADVYLYLAGMAVALRYGFEMAEALSVADSTYVDVNIHSKENAERVKTLASLPLNCKNSADELEKARNVFEAKGVFTPGLIDGALRYLRSYDEAKTEKAQHDSEEMRRLVREYFYV